MSRSTGISQPDEQQTPLFAAAVVGVDRERADARGTGCAHSASRPRGTDEPALGDDDAAVLHHRADRRHTDAHEVEEPRSSAARRGRRACRARASPARPARSSEHAALIVTAASASSSERPMPKQPRAIAKRQRGREAAAGVHVGRERHRRPGVDERARRRETAEAQVEGRRGQQRGDAATPRRARACPARRRTPGGRPSARRSSPASSRAAGRRPSSSAWMRSFMPVRARREQDAPALLDAEDAALAEDVGEHGEPPRRATSGIISLTSSST